MSNNNTNNTNNNVNNNAKKALTKEERAAIRKMYAMSLEEAPLSEVASDFGKNCLPNTTRKATVDGVIGAAGVGYYLLNPEEGIIAATAAICTGTTLVANQVLSDGGVAASELLVKRPFRTIKGWFSKKENKDAK